MWVSVFILDAGLLNTNKYTTCYRNIRSLGNSNIYIIHVLKLIYSNLWIKKYTQQTAICILLIKLNDKWGKCLKYYMQRKLWNFCQIKPINFVSFEFILTFAVSILISDSVKNSLASIHINSPSWSFGHWNSI